ncbi:DUF2938 domain-containing protein [Acinetobacter silvestris]|uniref:DUF2938 domain-containing protein n=1 Tax=Acinetobacter silvestris TaxID=1977882 RepID=A0A1Y3CHY3_9GAMM|nr:DUF2938 domain-containing protein [Acinetobacter silvestris]OTG66737.1 hypothetical protein B9T28_05765 [Acinetobacter silvestris]
MTSIELYSTIFIIAILATLWIDLYSFCLKRYFNIPSLDYKFVGRWIIYLFKGKTFHQTILQTPIVKGEKAIGWISHYLIGLIFSAIFILMVGKSWLANPQLLPALTFGLSTVIFPFLIMQPCFGFGVAASKLPQSNKARLKSLSTHALFGVGLYLGAIILKMLHPL